MSNWDADAEAGFARGVARGDPRLYTNRDRRAKALWNIFSDYGRLSHTIGWWMTYPVEPINGIMDAYSLPIRCLFDRLCPISGAFRHARGYHRAKK